MKRVLIFTFLFLLLLISVSARAPVCGESLTSSITFTAGVECGTGVQYGIIINANDITVDCGGNWLNGTYSGSSSGIAWVPGYSGVTIQNCKLSGWDTGISTNGANSTTIQSNTIKNSNSYGIASFISSGNSNIITQNIIENVTSLTSNAPRGIIIGGNNIIVSYNNISKLISNGSAGSTVGIQASGDLTNSTINNNIIHNASGGTESDIGIATSGGSNTNLTNNTIYDVQFGISNTVSPTISKNTRMIDNIINASAYGIYSNGNISTIQNNIITLTTSLGTQAIYIQGEVETISGNTIDANTANVAIFLNGVDAVVVGDNTITNALYAIQVSASSNATISGASFIDSCCSSYPIYVDGGGNIEITGVTFTDFLSSVIYVSGTTLLNVTSSTFDNVSETSSGFYASKSPMEYSGINYSNAIPFVDEGGGGATFVTADAISIPKATGLTNWGLYLGFAGTGSGIADNSTFYFFPSDGTNCTSVLATLNGLGLNDARCDFFLADALTAVDATTSYDNSVLLSAFNSTFNVTSGETYPPILEYTTLTSALIQRSNTAVTFSGNTVSDTTAEPLSTIESSDTVSQLVNPSSGASYTIITGGSSIALTGSKGSITWSGAISESGSLENNLFFGDRFVALDSSVLTNLNTAATVSISNVNCGNFNLYSISSYETSLTPIISGGTKIADETNLGGNCDSGCTSIDCSPTISPTKGTLTFTVTGFSSHGVDGPGVVPEFSTIAMIIAVLGVVGMFFYQRREE